MQSTTKTAAIAFGLAFVALAFLGVAEHAALAQSQPANKMSVSGSALDVMTAELTSGSSSEEHTLLTGTIKTSAPTDLIFRVTSECALWTNVQTMGNADSEAVASVKMWVTVDGTVVPVAADDTGDEAGKVVFCNRAYRQVTSGFDDENATIQHFLRSRNANAFNWMTLNVGSGTHTIELKGQLDVQVTGVGSAQAAVGKRTLIVEPEKLAVDAVI